MSTTKALRSNLAFTSILPLYQELKSAGGGLQPLNKNLNPGTAQVSPSISDFIADVELSALRSLGLFEYIYFNKHYSSCELPVDETPNPLDDNLLQAHIASFPDFTRADVAKMDERVRTKLGGRLIENHIYPLKNYIKPISQTVRVG